VTDEIIPSRTGNIELLLLKRSVINIKAGCVIISVVWYFLARNEIPAIIQPPRSPDLSPCQFWLFPTFKTGLEGHCLASVEEIQQYATADLRDIEFPKVLPAMAGLLE
jgi:hypothetical protein